MSVSIHLNRAGKKNKPFYRVVVADSKHRRDGKYIEKVGYYNPLKPEDFSLNMESIEKWISKGAKTSDTVQALIRRYKREQH
ncbi:MAG: 30S ribosomal protein S16 [Desulfuromonas sp. SDB]|nr:MAG: 30S ribosomal protein S16 [Desulfuromonas sp. SDB]